MFVIIWEYWVRTDRMVEFETSYSSQGAWADLFKKDPSYLGTELFHDSEHPQHFITIDRWTTSEAYNSFRAEWKTEYDALDARCQDMTERESLLGTIVPPGG